MEKIKGRKIKIDNRKGNVTTLEDVKLDSNSTKVRKRNINNNSDLEREEIVDVYSPKTIKRGKIKYSSLKKNKYDDFAIQKDFSALNMDTTLEEKVDREINAEDNLSIGVIILILFVCLILGIFIGYVLYRLALSNSALIMVLSNF